MSEDEIERRRQVFRDRLVAVADDAEIVRELVLGGPSYALGDSEYELRQVIATQFGLHPVRDVHVVGSAQLGFSINPNKRWRSFGDESDIDVAIVSPDLFRTYWRSVATALRDGSYWDKQGQALRWLGQGWIRPDLLPPHAMHDWFDFFRELAARRTFCSGIKISAGLYHDLEFLEQYQARGVAGCREVGNG